MKVVMRARAALLAIAATTAFAGEGERVSTVSPAVNPSWEFGLAPTPTVVRDGENYTSAIAVAADRGPLHLEARYNYQSMGARSAFAGWTFSSEEAMTWELTPLLGAAWGTTQALCQPGS